MPTLNNTASSAQSVNEHRIILASAFRREQHSARRQERAAKNLHRMPRFEDQSVKNSDRRLAVAADDFLDE